jgi:hypothetical protein
MQLISTKGARHAQTYLFLRKVVAKTIEAVHLLGIA